MMKWESVFTSNTFRTAASGAVRMGHTDPVTPALLIRVVGWP